MIDHLSSCVVVYFVVVVPVSLGRESVDSPGATSTDQNGSVHFAEKLIDPVYSRVGSPEIGARGYGFSFFGASFFFPHVQLVRRSVEMRARVMIFFII